MEFLATELLGVVIVTGEVQLDERGSFTRTFDAAAFEAAGLPVNWPHCNTSMTIRQGTLRGMHFQTAPRHDPKLVRCTRGRVFDVVVDLRPESKTICRWFGMELSHVKADALFVPAGCAHGFLTLEDDCEVFYMMAERYAPELARGVRWNDPAFGVSWPFDPIVISQRDTAWPDFLS